jgi:two-component system heavy metal sensor histidine kinase CusS
MSTWLTLYYSVSVFVLLAAASAFLYWGLERSMDQQNRDYVHQKMQVLVQLLQEQPLNRAGIEQEVREEAEISGHSGSPFFLRILDADDRLIVETPGMASILPEAVFPAANMTEPKQRSWSAHGGLEFLLGSVLASASAPTLAQWRVQAALNVSSEQGVLSRYRRDIAIVLICGLVIASAIGTVITRHGLRPVGDITRATERIGVQQLQERIQTGPWPRELLSLAAAFDRMLDRLQEAFERLSQFSADMAHELRNPINNLMGEAQVALARERTAPEYARVLQSALEEYGRLARMIDGMLFLAQAAQVRAALTPVLLDARAELQAVAEFYQALAEEQGVELVCEGQGTLVADPVLLRRALSNLLSNALKYTPRGGTVMLGAKQGPRRAQVLSVIDSGAGIAAHHLPKLGDRFYRVDPSRSDSPGGAGLGLAIVKSIMTLHDGKLLIESKVGAGTTASLVFSATTSREIGSA